MEFTNFMFATNSSKTTRRLTQVTAAASALVILSSGVALAWHPKGVITKGVTNVTADGTTISAADTNNTAISAKPGDTLKYTIVIKNDSPTANSYDDMGFTQLEDTLPAGVTLLEGKTSDNIGLVKAQKSVTRTITVKVNANVADGTYLDNKACFTGDATNREAGRAQSGCDHAIVKVTVPKTTPSPTPSPSKSPTPTPTKSPTPSPTPGATLGTATTLPETGAPILGSAIGLGAMITASAAYIKSRRNR